jgi:hypothetical protein
MPLLLLVLPACQKLLLLDIRWGLRLLEWSCLLLLLLLLLLLHGEKLLLIPLLV